RGSVPRRQRYESRHLHGDGARRHDQADQLHHPRANDAAGIGDPPVHGGTQDGKIGKGTRRASGTLPVSGVDQEKDSFRTGETGAQGNLGSLTLQSNGSYTYTVPDSAVQFLGPNDTKVDTFTVTAFDGTTKQISFTIHGANNPAVIGDPPVHDVTEDV